MKKPTLTLFLKRVLLIFLFLILITVSVLMYLFVGLFSIYAIIPIVGIILAIVIVSFLPGEKNIIQTQAIKMFQKRYCIKFLYILLALHYY